MRTIAMLGSFIAVLAAGATARAWDGHNVWNQSASGQPPGGGGIMGTGGALDYNITCARCHIKAAGKIDVTFTFNPPLQIVNGQKAYKPGQTYQIMVALIGEYLGKAGCGQFLRHINGFAASFENVGGKRAGVLASDSGQIATACQATLPDKLNGTTALSGDCHAIVSYDGVDGRTSWTFSWSAPGAGAGQVTMWYGAVDGNCDMVSLKDDVKTGSAKLLEGK